MSYMKVTQHVYIVFPSNHKKKEGLRMVLTHSACAWTSVNILIMFELKNSAQYIHATQHFKSKYFNNLELLLISSEVK